jgi:streptogramin lyase
MHTARLATRQIALVLVLPLCLGALVLSARAEAYVYWTNANGTIGRANLDGTGVNQAFVTGAGDAFNLAVDANHVYWTDEAGDAIGRADIDGTSVDPDFITGASGPTGIAVDANHIYWTSDGSVGRANLNGTGVDQNFLPAAATTFGVAVNANHIYWANYSTDAIGRANLDGTGATQELITSIDTPQGIAVGPDHVYWANYHQDGSAIGRARLDGSSVETTFVPGLDNPYGVAVDGGHVYWADYSGPNAVGRAALDGGAIARSFVAANGPRDVAVDPLPLPPDTDPPETTITKGAPNKTDRSKVKFKFESSEPGSTFECKKDRKRWKACASPTKMKRLDEGRHKFKVRATDAAGNVGTAAKDAFRVAD